MGCDHYTFSKDNYFGNIHRLNSLSDESKSYVLDSLFSYRGIGITVEKESVDFLFYSGATINLKYELGRGCYPVTNTDNYVLVPSSIYGIK